MKNEEGNPVTRAEVEAAILYGFIALLAGGAAGLYIPFFMGKAPGVDGLATYVLAVLAPFFADSMLSESYWKKLTKVLRLRLGLATVVAAVLAVIALLGASKQWGIPLGALAMFLVLPIWFFQAVYSGRFRPEPSAPTRGAIGGGDEDVHVENLGGEGLPS